MQITMLIFSCMNKHYKKARASGAALVELAIVIIPLLIFVFGVVEVGRGIYQQNQLTKIVQTIGRYMSRGDGVVDVGTCTKINSANEWNLALARAVKLSIYSAKLNDTIDGSSVPLLPGMSSSSLLNVIPDTAPVGLNGCVIKVSASVPFDNIFSGSLFGFMEGVNLNVTTEERYIGE